MSAKQKEALLIMPAHNEAASIGSVLEILKSTKITDRVDILVINDFSTDDTAKIVEDAGLHVMNVPFNMGYGNVIQLGYKYAKQHGYRYVVQMDADGQHDCCNIPLMLDELHKPDAQGNLPNMVIGSRFLSDKMDMHVSSLKQFAISIFRRIIKGVTGQTILDPTSGLIALNAEAFTCFGTYGFYDDRYPDSNMVLQMLLLGFHLREIPAVMHDRESGTSMHSGIFKPALYMMRMSLSIISVLIRSHVLKVKRPKYYAPDHTAVDEA